MATSSSSVYPSKKSIVLIGFVYLILGVFILLSWRQNTVFSIIFNLFFIAFFTHLFFSTKYTVKEGVLLVQSGFLVKQNIDISSIRKITETYSWWSAPAFSPERLEVFYNRFDSVVISPADKAGFIRHLLEINPGIGVENSVAE